MIHRIITMESQELDDHKDVWADVTTKRFRTLRFHIQPKPEDSEPHQREDKATLNISGLIPLMRRIIHEKKARCRRQFRSRQQFERPTSRPSEPRL